MIYLRNTALRTVIALLLALWMLASSQLLSAQAPGSAREAQGDDTSRMGLSARRRPNIIVILSDDHRYDYLSRLGHPFVSTPNLDRLADQGVVFSNAFVTTSLCSPSRASFLTGQYASTHGVENNFTPWNPESTTFLELLAGDGYDAAFIGKWHMPGANEAEALPELHGVNPFVTFTVNDGQGIYYDCPLVVNGEPQPGTTPYITTELTNRAVDFITAKRDAPFVLYLSHKAAHANFLPPRDLEGIYDGESVRLPNGAHPWVQATRGQLTHGILRPLPAVIRDYAETIAGLDVEIGRVLDALDSHDLADNTVVVYTSDNGYLWGEGGLVDKRWAYETAMRVPLIVRYPAVARPGADAEAMVLNVDLAPTLLDLAGTPVPRAMEGVSWATLLEEPTRAVRDSFVYEYFLDFPFPVPELRAVRTERYKLIDYHSRRPDELFDLVADPEETTNLLEERRAPASLRGPDSLRALEATLRARLEAWEDRAEGGSR